ncbi:MAG: hypothetical protein CVU39_00090 [Chloroflexi bacterium HGW-Chloroflexi-10]|nr:MAG: hypothetical protein CVU39_00090 [Chloroflexi bacterium HGW-Chloroflexi-10]
MWVRFPPSAQQIISQGKCPPTKLTSQTVSFFCIFSNLRANAAVVINYCFSMIIFELKAYNKCGRELYGSPHIIKFAIRIIFLFTL